MKTTQVQSGFSFKSFACTVYMKLRVFPEERQTNKLLRKTGVVSETAVSKGDLNRVTYLSLRLNQIAILHNLAWHCLGEPLAQFVERP